jgi:hypothetical protein
MDETRGSVPPEGVRRELAARQRLREADLRQTSSTPEHLLDDDVVRKLLHQLNSVDQSRSAKQLNEAPRLDVDGRNRVSPQEIEKVFASMSAPAPDQVPSLTENLAQERRWILIDLAKNGSGLARQRATRELRDDMQSVASWEGFDLHLLEQLVAELGEASAAGAPMLFEALRVAAARAVAALAREAGAES